MNKTSFMLAITGAGKLGFLLLINTLLCHGRETQNKHTNMNIDELVKKAQTAEPKDGNQSKYKKYLPVIDELLAKGFKLYQATNWIKENDPSIAVSGDSFYAAMRSYCKRRTSRKAAKAKKQTAGGKQP